MVEWTKFQFAKFPFIFFLHGQRAWSASLLCAHAACHENELSDSMEGSPAYTVLNFHDFSVPIALLLKKKKKKKCYFLLFFYVIFSLHLSECFSLVWFVISLALFIVNVLYYNMPSKVLNLRKMPCIYYTAVFGIIMELQLSLEEQSGCGIVAKPQTGRRVIYFNFYQQSNSKKVLP